MTLTKSLLLGSAATLVAFGAQAADLPSQKAAPVAYVKVCDAYGAGFFVIPGTDTCIRIGGYVRAEYQYVPAQNSYSLRYANSTTLNLQGVNANIAGAGTNAYMVTSTSGSALSATSSALAPANVGTSFQPLVEAPASIVFMCSQARLRPAALFMARSSRPCRKMLMRNRPLVMKCAAALM